MRYITVRVRMLMLHTPTLHQSRVEDGPERSFHQAVWFPVASRGPYIQSVKPEVWAGTTWLDSRRLEPMRWFRTWPAPVDLVDASLMVVSCGS